MEMGRVLKNMWEGEEGPWDKILHKLLLFALKMCGLS